MVISHYGLGMVKITLGERVIVFSPIGKRADSPAGGEPVKFGADLALVSLNDAAYNGVEQVTRGEKKPFVIDGPGEYEVEGNFIQGFATAGPGSRINTVYLLVLDGLRLVHLGALAETTVSDKLVEALGAIDILFLPVGQGDLLETKAAARIATLLEPRAVVPVNYNQKTLAAFLKEMGEEKSGAVESWAVKKKDLVEKEGEVMVVKSF